MALVFFISLSACYASNVCDYTQNKNYILVEDLSKDLDSSLNNKINIDTKNDSVNLKTNNNGILASGVADRPVKISQENIINASKNVDKFITKNGKLPNYVTIENYSYTMPEFMYLLAKTIQYKYKKVNSQVTIKYDVGNPAKPIGNNIKGDISSKNINNYTTRVANFIAKNNIAPNYVSIPFGKMQYQATIHSFIKILGTIKDNKLAGSVSFNYKKANGINKFMPKFLRPDTAFSKALNDLYVNGSLEEYLKASKNCQVNDESIQSLSKSITKNSKTNLQKATAIFNWVRDKVVYVFYYNTKSGAKNTINKKSGNCVDQSHLLVALARASGIPTRYVHGKCTFTSGKTYGHVWAQILVNDVWTVADASSTKNSLGIIKSWTSYTIHGKYDEIPF